MRFSPPGRRMSFGPRITPAVGWMIGVEVGVFLLYLFVGKDTRAVLQRWLVLTPDSLAEGHVWKLVTTALMNESGLAFFFDVLMLWLFVPVLEGFWGTRRFLWFALLTTVVGGAVGGLVGLLLGGPYGAVKLVGLSPFVYASIAAYGVVFARQQVQFFGVLPIKGKHLAIGTACFVGLFVLLEGAWVSGAAFFSAMGLAVSITTGWFTPNLWWLQWRRRRLRRKYVVLDGGEKGPPSSKKQWLN